MTSAPLVSVVIATFNSGRTLRPTIESVLLQTVQDFEVWVVGDGCTDDSGDVVGAFADPRVHWVNLERNWGGPSRPRNEGWRRARGRYVAYLGHDDLWFPWHLEELVAAIEANEAGFAYSVAALLSPNGAPRAFSLPLRRSTFRDGISPSNWLHRRDLEESVGRWRAGLRAAEDREFHSRLLASGTRLAFSRRLSVLKYPAVIWRLYDPEAQLPQAPDARRMAEDPAGFEREVLSRLVVAMSQDAGSADPPWARGPARKLARRLCDLYGRDRWPLNRLLYARYRRLAGLS